MHFPYLTSNWVLWSPPYLRLKPLFLFLYDHYRTTIIHAIFTIIRMFTISLSGFSAPNLSPFDPASTCSQNDCALIKCLVTPLLKNFQWLPLPEKTRIWMSLGWKNKLPCLHGSRLTPFSLVLCGESFLSLFFFLTR